MSKMTLFANAPYRQSSVIHMWSKHLFILGKNCTQMPLMGDVCTTTGVTNRDYNTIFLRRLSKGFSQSHFSMAENATGFIDDLFLKINFLKTDLIYYRLIVKKLGPLGSDDSMHGSKLAYNRSFGKTEKNTLSHVFLSRVTYTNPSSHFWGLKI